MKYICAPSRVLSHIHVMNSDLRLHFIICGYGIFLSIRHAISFRRTMSMYDLCISFTFPFVFRLCRHWFVTFSFVSTLYPVLSSSISTLDYILSPPVSILESIYSQFDLTLTTFPKTFSSKDNCFTCSMKLLFIGSSVHSKICYLLSLYNLMK